MRFSKHTERAVLRVVAAVLTALASNSNANAQESLRVGLPVPGESIYSPVYVAEEAGIYAKKGLKVEITPYRGAGAAQESLAAGGADIINLVPSGAAVAISKGVKEQIVGCGPQLAPDEWHIMVLANSPAKTVKDLNGQKIGVPAKNGTSDYYAQWAAEKAGITVQPTRWAATRGHPSKPARSRPASKPLQLYCAYCQAARADRSWRSKRRWNWSQTIRCAGPHQPTSSRVSQLRLKRSSKLCRRPRRRCKAIGHTRLVS